MAIGSARSVSTLLALAAIGAASIIAPTLASAAPHAQPYQKPSVDTVQKQLGELALKNSQLVEQYDQAQVAVQKREKAAAKAQVSAGQAQSVYNSAHAQFAQIVQEQYESGSLGAAAALLDSSSDTNYLDRLDTLNMVTTHTAQVVDQVMQARDTATSSADNAQSLLDAAKTDRDALAQKRQTVEKQIKKYQTLLSTLTSPQQYAYKRMSNPTLTASALSKMHLTKAGSAAAQKAVQFALSQVGKPYYYGASGPGSYDCSGLTMEAWRRGGVSLPHSAADQYNYGHHVSRSNLQPGDLIFFYQPIGHVTIYIGDGLMVSAPTEGEDVSVVPLSAFNSDYVGATRLT